MLLQAWHSPQRPFALAAVGTATLAGLISLVTFNFAFSGDWMGHFHPGNAWGEGVLRFSTLATSLPGQWLQRDMGLGNSSPVFFFALLGLVFLLYKSSHSLRLLIISFYFATLVVNGLNGADWVMGHCYPARFFVVAVPLLLLGLTAFLDTSYSRPVLLFFFLCALSITLDTVIEISKVPERGFIGYALPVRAINYFYPWDIHFYPEKDRAWPLGDLTFWGTLLAGAFSLLYYREKMPSLARAGLLLLLALLPYLGGKSTVFQDRMRQYFHTFTVTAAIADAARPEHHFTAHFPLTRSSIYTTGDYLPDGTFSAQENKNPPGLLSSHTMSILKPGIYQLAYSNMQSVGPTDRPVGYALISQRDNVAAFSKWEKRINLPIKDALHDTWSTAFYVDRTNIGYAQIAFRGLGRLSHQHVNLIKIDGSLNLNVEPFHYFPLAKKAEGGAGIAAGGSYTALPAGAYKARFEVSGASLSTFFRRAPAPIKMAVFTRPVGIESAQEIKERFAQWWQSDAQSNSATAFDFLPLVESTQAPWWTAIPIGSDTAFEVFFSLEEPQDIWFLIGYRGPEEIELEGIALDRVTLAL